MNTEQCEQRLAQAHRDLQATEQALSDERIAGRNAFVVAAAAHEFCKVATETCDADEEFAALLAAHRATTPSETPTTHVVVPLDEMRELREAIVDYFAAVKMGAVGAKRAAHARLAALIGEVA